jgi:hypothetical protein
MSEILANWGVWSWWILAGILLFAEIIVPGAIFIWLALAAAAVGTVNFYIEPGWQIEVLLFALFSIVFVLVLRPRFADRMRASEPPNLNQRMLDQVGRTFQLSQPIVNGRGRLSIDDTLWEIEGPDLTAGQKVRVTGVTGTRFTVEAA